MLLSGLRRRTRLRPLRLRMQPLLRRTPQARRTAKVHHPTLHRPRRCRPRQRARVETSAVLASLHDPRPEIPSPQLSHSRASKYLTAVCPQVLLLLPPAPLPAELLRGLRRRTRLRP